MLQLPHPYLYLLFPRGMYTGSSFVTPSSVSSLTIVTSPSSSSCSSFTGVVGLGVGIGVEVGVVVSFSDLRSCGNSPVPTSKHVFSNMFQPSEIILCPAATVRIAATYNNTCLYLISFDTSDIMPFILLHSVQCTFDTSDIKQHVSV